MFPPVHRGTGTIVIRPKPYSNNLFCSLPPSFTQQCANSVQTGTAAVSWNRKLGPSTWHHRNQEETPVDGSICKNGVSGYGSVRPLSELLVLSRVLFAMTRSVGALMDNTIRTAFRAFARALLVNDGKGDRRTTGGRFVLGLPVYLSLCWGKWKAETGISRGNLVFLSRSWSRVCIGSSIRVY